MQYSKPAFREVYVRPMSSWREATYVLGLIALIILMVYVRISFLQDRGGKIFMQPYHRLDNTLGELERPMYQAFLASENELLLIWEENGEWPSSAALAEDGIPPFATDMLAGPLRDYTWTTYNREQWVDYLGVGKQDGVLPSVLLRVINLHADYHPHPHPGIDYDPNQKAALQIWLHPEARQRYAGMQLIERGWSWVVSPDDPSLSVPEIQLKMKSEK